MGLFKELALLPLAPLRGTVWIGEFLAEEAERQLYDEDGIKRELLQLEIEGDEGALSEKERAAREDELLDRLAISRQRQAEELEQMPLEPTLDVEEEEGNG